MANDMVALANGTLGAAANSVSFTSISQDYKDLLLICTMPSFSQGNVSLSISFNGNSPASNRIFLQGRSSSQTVSSGASNVAASNMANSPTAVNCSVLGYSATDKGKVALVRSGNNSGVTSDQTSLTLLSQNSTTAITSITINIDGAKTMGVNSEFALYGIR